MDFLFLINRSTSFYNAPLSASSLNLIDINAISHDLSHILHMSINGQGLSLFEIQNLILRLLILATDVRLDVDQRAAATSAFEVDIFSIRIDIAQRSIHDFEILILVRLLRLRSIVLQIGKHRVDVSILIDDLLLLLCPRARTAARGLRRRLFFAASTHAAADHTGHHHQRNNA